ncbi:MAG: type-F conjugative transfer system protein TraW [Nitrospinae bacterium]|nr:type-F conjugative transfer system protein TraW [Nitrospinota bacterium]
MRRYLFLSLHIVAAISIILLAGSAAAKDLGVRGAVWHIAEPDLLTEIEARLEAMKASGELAKMGREAAERARERVEAPPRVAGIRPARFLRIRRFDPSVTIERDVFAANGKLIAAKGMRINPLERHPLTRDLLFIDATRPVEVEWALRHENPSVIVLLAGRPLELMRAHGRAFFFDQGGRLAKRFGLAATPSLLEAEGLFLRITEVPLEDEPESEGDRP